MEDEDPVTKENREILYLLFTRPFIFVRSLFKYFLTFKTSKLELSTINRYFVLFYFILLLGLPVVAPNLNFGSVSVLVFYVAILQLLRNISR